MPEELYELALWDSPAGDQLEAASTLRAASLISSSAATPAASISDKAVGHVYGTDTSGLPSLGADLEGFAHWSDVASTLYNKLYQISQYNPSEVGYSAPALASLRYSFSTSPFWNTQFSVATRDLTIRDQRYSPVVHAIEDFAEDSEIAPESARGIVRNIKRVAELASEAQGEGHTTDPTTPQGPVASEPTGGSQKRSLFHNATIAVTAGNLHVVLMYAVVSLEFDRQKGRYRPLKLSQSVQIVFGHGVLDFDFCKRHARSVLTYDRKTVEAWQAMAAANSRPESTSGGWPIDV